MIPISLNIKGLYSYREETFIDFTNLTAAGLFGIFGAVGSGKSTILEAISFALYGETERLNKSDKRSYNMMNLRSKQLLIDFIFTCGDCDLKYRFTVSARRNSKNFSDGGKIERQAYVWENNWTPTELDAEKILGLSYDNFKRTTIIPQGKFQEFLQLKESDRVQMLKEIFSLEKFELSPKVAKLSKENEIKLAHLHGQMQALPVYNEELLHEKETHISLLENGVREISDYLKNKEFEEKALQELKALFIDANAKSNAFDVLKSKEKNIDELYRQIEEIERCQQVFKYPIEKRKKVKLDLSLIESDVEKLQARKTAIDASIAIETTKVESLKEAYSNRELLLQKATELEKIVSIKSLQESIRTLSSRIEKGDQAVESEEEKLGNIKAKLAVIKSQIALEERSLPDTSLLISVSNWFTSREQLDTNLKKAERELALAYNKAAKVKVDIEARLQQLPGEMALLGFPETLFAVKDEIDTLIKEYDRQLHIVKDEQNQVKLLEKLDDFAKTLTDESECPLCGSIHHPKVFSAANTIEDIHHKQTFIDDLENKKDSLHSTLVHLSGLYSNYDTYSSQYNQKRQELLKQKDELECYKSKFSFTGYTSKDEELVKKQLSEMEVRNLEMKKLRIQRDEKENEAEESAKKITTYKAGIEKFKTDKAQHEGQLETLRNQLLLINFATEINKPVSELTKGAEALKTQFIDVTKEFEKAEEALQENNKLLATLTGRIDEREKQVNAAVIEFAELTETINELLIREGYDSEQQVEQLLATKLDIKKEKDKVEAFRRELHAATIQLEEATAKVEGKEYIEEVHLEVQKTIQNLSKDLTDKTEKLATEKFELHELKQRMQARVALQKDLDKLTLRAENLKVLSNLFRSSGFVNYVSSVYLQNLINSANQRFYKMTRQKLMLELADDNAFRVRDFMNNGEVRSVKTLSGGQTFQAALSLALALADNIQHLTKSKQNFFFLDEGFGSLDKDALTIVFDTLKGLRKENRIVGVISHVEEMQQEIPVNLKIVNDLERGSLFTKSWD